MHFHPIGSRVVGLVLLGCLGLAGCKKEAEPPPDPAPEMTAEHRPPGLESLELGTSTRADVFALLGDAEMTAPSGTVIDGDGKVKGAAEIATWRSAGWLAANPDGDPDAAVLTDAFDGYETLVMGFGDVDGNERLVSIGGYTDDAIGVCQRVKALDSDADSETCTDGFDPTTNERCAAVDGRNVRIFCVEAGDPEVEVDGYETGTPDSGERFDFRLSL